MCLLNGPTPWCRRSLFTWSFGASFEFAKANHASSFLAFNVSTKPFVTKPPIGKGKSFSYECKAYAYVYPACNGQVASTVPLRQGKLTIATSVETDSL